jgi:hypothetical protein
MFGGEGDGDVVLARVDGRLSELSETSSSSSSSISCSREAAEICSLATDQGWIVAIACGKAANFEEK